MIKRSTLDEDGEDEGDIVEILAEILREGGVYLLRAKLLKRHDTA